MTDELDRLNAMLDPHQQTWDLSPNDIAAIRWAVDSIRSLQQQLNAANVGREFLDNCFGDVCVELNEARDIARQLYRLQLRWSETERKFVQKTEWLSAAKWLDPSAIDMEDTP